jgi:hypothetical protein
MSNEQRVMKADLLVTHLHSLDSWTGGIGAAESGEGIMMVARGPCYGLEQRWGVSSWKGEPKESNEII